MDIAKKYDTEIDGYERILHDFLVRLKTDVVREIRGVFIDGRVKAKASLLRKALGNASKTYNWEELEDIVACKIVVPRKADLSRVERAVTEVDGWQVDAKIHSRNPDQLKYSSLHLIVRTAEYTDSVGIPVPIEIQLRTLAEDAWYVADHPLRYKTEEGLSSDSEFKRRILRLMVLPEIFDDEVEHLMRQRESLPEYQTALLFEDVTKVHDELTGVPSGVREHSTLFSAVLTAYKEEEKDHVLAIIQDFIASNGPMFLSVVAEHSSGSADFVDSRDWIYSQPESLLIAERSINAPAMVRHALKNQDNAFIINDMVATFQRDLRSSV